MQNIRNRQPILQLVTMGSLLALLGLSQNQAGAQITNGSFETGDLTGWSSIAPVQVRSDEGASDGIYAAVFNYGNVAPGGFLYQDITTVVGQQYTLKYDFGGYGAANTETIQAQVIEDPETSPNYIVDQTVSATGSIPTVFTTYTDDFTATSTDTRIGFADGTFPSDGINADPILDNVSVTADVSSTPEPGSIALFAGMVTFGAAMLRRRRKRQAIS